ncbi:DOK2 protein, partial [Chaetops frenatus]|nr:DOK2 protein [Chaetops frenatus]
GLEQAFEVTVRVTPSSQRCGLRGRYVLRAAEEALELWPCQGQEPLFLWPYRFLRRFGRDKVGATRGGRAAPWLWPGADPAPAPPQVTFSFEAGRRCASGEGNFEFDTRQGNQIFQAIEAAIEVQRGRGGFSEQAPRPLDHAGTPSRAQGHEEANAKAEPEAWRPGGAKAESEAWRPSSAKAEPEAWRPGGAKAECEYAVPFDTIAKSFLALQFGGLGCPQEGVPEPLSVPREAAGGQQPPSRPMAPKPEHIYDEPEGLSALSVYDEPEEVKGEAWRLQAAPEEPPGLACPYNPQRDDYAVPKKAVPMRQPFLLQGREWLGDSEYDNVALRVAKK